MIVVLNGFIGKGINGVTEMKIKTNDNINLKDDITTFKGSIICTDSFFKDHPLAGERTFTVKTDNIVCLVD